MDLEEENLNDVVKYAEKETFSFLKSLLKIYHQDIDISLSCIVNLLASLFENIIKPGEDFEKNADHLLKDICSQVGALQKKSKKIKVGKIEMKIK